MISLSEFQTLDFSSNNPGFIIHMNRPKLLVAKIFHQLSGLPIWQLGGGSFVLLGIIGITDYLITIDLGLSIFYLLPIAALTWYLHPRLGYFSSVISTLLWCIAEIERESTTNLFFVFWNALVRLAFFTLVVALLAELKMAYQQEQRLARTDGLTTLLNRRAFTEILEQEIERSNRHALAFTLVYLDIDNFKQVNDKFGHAAGDRLLKEIAIVLVQQVRATDHQCRLGGDEFAILMPQTNQAQANPVLKRLFDELLLLKSTDSPIGFSVGAVSFVDPLPNSADQALGAADKLMYAVKASGKNQVVQARYEG